MSCDFNFHISNIISYFSMDFLFLDKLETNEVVDFNFLATSSFSRYSMGLDPAHCTILFWVGMIYFMNFFSSIIYHKRIEDMFY